MRKPRQSVFTLTTAETEILSEHDSGSSPREIAARRGFARQYVTGAINTAREKLRLAAAVDRYSRHMGMSDVSTAKGRVMGRQKFIR